VSRVKIAMIIVGRQPIKGKLHGCCAVVQLWRPGWSSVWSEGKEWNKNLSINLALFVLAAAKPVKLLAQQMSVRQW